MNDPALLRMTYPDAQLHAGGHRHQVLTAVRSPNIVVLGGFLDEDACRDLIDLARPRMKRSSVVHHAEGVRIDETRTSSGCHFRRGEVALVAGIEQRIAELTDIPPENGEGLQVLHYLPGQHYVPHWDYFPPESPSSADIVRPEFGGQRVATFIAYLNTVPLGGETEFPRASVKVAAVQGNACFFSYRTADGQPDPLTLHSGNAVIDGEKWIAVKWLREGRYPQ
ncbi:MAG: 2OG-Fe(II) oxygenase [Ralstonia sp.]|jgi:prolyl 4-hydroxylase|nr:MAG: 2OG-Fe(II) oxygenase [Ralstonia sp.]